MDLTPYVNVAIMGALGYGLGVAAKIDPKWTTITWAVAEIAMQLFKRIDEFKKYSLEYPVRLLVGAGACLYLSEHHALSKINFILASMVTFCIVPDIISRVYGGWELVSKKQ